MIGSHHHPASRQPLPPSPPPPIAVPTAADTRVAAVQLSPPIIDLANEEPSVLASELRAACSEFGVFIAINHGIDRALLDSALDVGHRFFDLPLHVKQCYSLVNNGTRWRGYMAQGGERSEGGTRVDAKEGLYLGEEHAPNDPRVLAGLPTFGSNVLPDKELPEMREIMSRCMKEMKGLGDRVMDGLSLALGLEPSYLQDHVTERDPVILPRLFRYPPQEHRRAPSGHGGLHRGESREAQESESWGIGKHSDYGLWTMILTDQPGLEFQHPRQGTWYAVPLVPGGIVMSVGDVLDRLTSGRFCSAYHRARNRSCDVPRLSLPFFYDPSWTSRMKTLPMPAAGAPQWSDAELEAIRERWARTKIRCKFDGRVAYSEFLAKKVAKVFPDVVPKSLWSNFDSTTAPSTRHVLVVPVPEKRSTSALLCAIESQRQRVMKHPLYAYMSEAAGGEASMGSMGSTGRLVGADTIYPPPPSSSALASPLSSLIRCFMEHHVWVVWDYFQLLKRLQSELTCTQVPWVPVGDRQLRRFINEIVLEEETDLFEDGKTYGSHLELYLRGMDQAGADTRPMNAFLATVVSVAAATAGGGDAVTAADAVADHAAACGAPAAAAAHIRSTLRLAMGGSTAEVAAVFAFGREDIIPGMFARVLPSTGEVHGSEGRKGSGEGMGTAATSIFRYYLERHIELDEKDHGPLAIRLVETFCNAGGTDAWAAATAAVNEALAKREALWQAVQCRVAAPSKL